MNANTTASTKTDNRLADLMDVVEESRGIHPAIEKILDGIVELAHSDLTVEQTALVAVAIGGDFDADVLRALALLTAHLTDPHANESLRALPVEAQERTREAGQLAADGINDLEITLRFTQVSAAIDGV